MESSESHRHAQSVYSCSDYDAFLHQVAFALFLKCAVRPGARECHAIHGGSFYHKFNTPRDNRMMTAWLREAERHTR